MKQRKDLIDLCFKKQTLAVIWRMTGDKTTGRECHLGATALNHVKSHKDPGSEAKMVEIPVI